MQNLCELELRIDWIDRGVYQLSARFVDPVADQENELFEPSRIRVDVEALNTSPQDRYGERITEMLFGGEGSQLRRAYEKAKAAAARREGLRIRLAVQPSAPELHAVRWERLLDPARRTPLLFQDGIWFSRFLSAEDFQLRPLPESEGVRCLIVVANPTDAARWRVAAIDAQAEILRAVRALENGGANGTRRIAHQALGGPASTYSIISTLRERYADILYLIGHGTLTEEGKPRLLLQKEDGSGQSVEAEELVERFRDMRERPRLVVLASCQSAAPTDQGALAALGPRLARAGVPSVIAMQGKVSVETVEKFMPTFFRELGRTGQVDRAMSLARAEIRERPDWWMPVLFMRLRTGSIWPRTVEVAGRFDRWDAVLTDLGSHKCVPVLGPGLIEPLFGSTRDIAQRWAERYEFPLAPRNRDDLSQVAQYLAYRQSKATAIAELREYLVAHIRKTYVADLPRELLDAPVVEGLVDRLILQVGRKERARNKGDPHRLLARLPCPVFINANRNNLLRDALKEAGKRPRIQVCTWQTSGGKPVPIEVGDAPQRDYKPSVDEPLVFHVFGNMEVLESLVVTEDDYFSFLVEVTRNEGLKKASIPRVVESAVATSGLLLLGFQIDDWDLRALLHTVLEQPGQYAAGLRARVAVQIDPAEGRFTDPERAISYLENYFGRAASMNIYWGSPESFLARLVRQCVDRGLVREDEEVLP